MYEKTRLDNPFYRKTYIQPWMYAICRITNIRLIKHPSDIYG